MLAENLKIVNAPNGQKYPVFKDVNPVFSAIHTKLAKDKLLIEQEILYILGGGYAFEVINGDIHVFNQTFINDLSSVLGIYFEEYYISNHNLFFMEVQRNLKMNIAPPMAYFFWGEVSYLAIIIQVNSDKTYTVINPITKEVTVMPEQFIDYSKSWIMLNSPRFAKPVFRDLNTIIKLALIKFCQTRKQLKLQEEQKFISVSEEKLIDCLVSNNLYRTINPLREFFKTGLELVCKYLDIDLKQCIQNVDEAMILWIRLRESSDVNQVKKLLHHFFIAENVAIAELQMKVQEII